MTSADLHIAEIRNDDGTLHCRYSRYLAPDGTRWIRHGLFVAYYPDGTLASEGHYQNGLEQGTWRDFHENGCVAAEGSYEHGEKCDDWKFWSSDGTPEPS